MIPRAAAFSAPKRWGADGVDKRIDVLATAIRQEMTVFDLEELELAYAPPFSSAKDPVNMAGFTAANIIKGDMQVFHWADLLKADADDYFVLDARTKIEYENGHFHSAVNLPLDSLRQHLQEIPRDKKVLVYCKVGLRAYLACRILMQNGFDTYNLSGGLRPLPAVQRSSRQGLRAGRAAYANRKKK